MTTGVSALLLALVVVQTLALLVLLRRMLPGRNRGALIRPTSAEAEATTSFAASVSVVIATLNEAKRIGPCLEGLHQQGPALREVIVVDSRSTDGTRELVQQFALRDARFRVIIDDVLPPGWVGKVWALETGLQHAGGEWVLGIDADTAPMPGMVSAIVRAMEEYTLDAASFGPRFAGQSSSERWIQPAMLMTLIYRTGSVGTEPGDPERVLANGQCFMVRRSTLLANGGYAVARASFSDDVTLARHLARRGVRVGFLDGSNIISVRAYRSAREMWREWGRSFDLKDGTSQLRRWLDVAFVWLTMALPVPVLIVCSALHIHASLQNDGLSAILTRSPHLVSALMAVNALLFGVRISLLFATRGSYERRGAPFWLSWLADIPASIRLTISTARRPQAWRGRSYNLQEEVQG